MKPEDAETYLRGLGLAVREPVIREVVFTLRGETAASLRSLYATGRDREGKDRHPICGKGTAYKIKRLYKEGQLEPYLVYLDAAGSSGAPSENRSQFGLKDIPSTDTVWAKATEEDADTVWAKATEEDAAQAERSGHWSSLRQAAASLREQTWVSLPQLLGIAYACGRGRYNQMLSLRLIQGRCQMALEAEESLLVGALRQHLAGHQLWEPLEQWEAELGGIMQGFELLCAWVKRQLESTGQWGLGPEELGLGMAGLADLFHQTIVLGAGEDALQGVPLEQEYSITTQGAGVYSLYWKHGPFGADIVTGSSQEDLTRLKDLHWTLQQKVRGLEELEAVVVGCREAQVLNKALGQAMQSIEHLPRFPGICQLFLASQGQEP